MPVEVYVGVFYGLAETGFSLERLDFQWWVARERLVSGGAGCQMGKFGQRSRTAGSVVYCAPLGNGTPYAIALGVQDAETTVSSEGSIIGHPSLYSIIFVFGRTDIYLYGESGKHPAHIQPGHRLYAETIDPRILSGSVQKSPDDAGKPCLCSTVNVLRQDGICVKSGFHKNQSRLGSCTCISMNRPFSMR